VTKFGSVPKNCIKLTLPPATYVVFARDDHVTQLRKTYEAIWNDWFPKSGKTPAEAPALSPQRYIRSAYRQWQRDDLDSHPRLTPGAVSSQSRPCANAIHPRHSSHLGYRAADTEQSRTASRASESDLSMARRRTVQPAAEWVRLLWCSMARRRTVQPAANTAYLLKESFDQVWSYKHEAWVRRFFDNWRASLKWQRLKPYEKFADMIDSHWAGIAASCKPENKVSLGFVEGLNNKIGVIQRRAYGLRDEKYLRLKVLTCRLPML
jgi:hypothetical protein